ncbi:MAG: hypothetical protein ACRC80_11225 [Waterburya sp.]
MDKYTLRERSHNILFLQWLDIVNARDCFYYGEGTIDDVTFLKNTATKELIETTAYCLFGANNSTLFDFHRLAYLFLSELEVNSNWVLTYATEIHAATVQTKEHVIIYAYGNFQFFFFYKNYCSVLLPDTLENFTDFYTPIGFDCNDTVYDTQLPIYRNIPSLQSSYSVR